MKNFFLILCLNLGFIHNINASTIDSLLIKDYQYEYEYVFEIAEHENLTDSIIDKPFFSLYTENIWSIIIKEENSFILYYGFRKGEKRSFRKDFSADHEVLSVLFKLDRNHIKKSVTKKDYYTPLWWYCVLADSYHNRNFEWNNHTFSKDKYTKKSLKLIYKYINFLFVTSFEDEYGKDIY